MRCCTRHWQHGRTRVAGAGRSARQCRRRGPAASMSSIPPASCTHWRSSTVVVAPQSCIPLPLCGRNLASYPDSQPPFLYLARSMIPGTMQLQTLPRAAGQRCSCSRGAASRPAAAHAVRKSSSSTSRRQFLHSVMLLATTLQPGSANADVSQGLELLLPGQPPAPPELPKRALARTARLADPSASTRSSAGLMQCTCLLCCAAYQRTMHKLVRALQTSIEAEAAGAKEFEVRQQKHSSVRQQAGWLAAGAPAPTCCCLAQVRRKADPAKELVKEFVGKWQDNAAVAGDITHDEMKGAHPRQQPTRLWSHACPRSPLACSAAAAELPCCRLLRGCVSRAVPAGPLLPALRAALALGRGHQGGGAGTPSGGRGGTAGGGEELAGVLSMPNGCPEALSAHAVTLLMQKTAYQPAPSVTRNTRGCWAEGLRCACTTALVTLLDLSSSRWCPADGLAASAAGIRMRRSMHHWLQRAASGRSLTRLEAAGQREHHKLGNALAATPTRVQRCCELRGRQPPPAVHQQRCVRHHQLLGARGITGVVVWERRRHHSTRRLRPQHRAGSNEQHAPHSLLYTCSAAHAPHLLLSCVWVDDLGAAVCCQCD